MALDLVDTAMRSPRARLMVRGALLGPRAEEVLGQGLAQRNETGTLLNCVLPSKKRA